MNKLTLRLWCALAATGLVPLINGCSGGSGNSPLFDIPPLSAAEKIVFVRPGGNVSNARGTGPIWIADADGKNEIRLTATNDGQPALGSSRIAFTRANQLWTMKLDGSDATRMTTGNVVFSNISDPTWKQGDQQITFTGQAQFATLSHIYSLVLRDNSVIQLTGTADNPNTAINSATPEDTLRETEFTSTRSNEFDPEWSSDGTQLVFATDRHFRLNPGENQQKTVPEIYKLSFASSSSTPTLTRMTRHFVAAARFTGAAIDGSTGNPTFSPNGTRVFFESADIVFGKAHIFSIDSGANALTPAQWFTISSLGINTSPSVAPDGQKLAVSRDGNIVRLNNGSESGLQTLITKGLQPSWRRIVTIAPTPTPRPTATPRPTTVPNSGSSIAAQSFVTLKREANRSVSRFPNQGITGDHEADGSGAIQTVVTYPLNSIPAGATINSAILDLAQTPRDGNPFGNLGPSYVELASTDDLNEGALQTNAIQISTTRVEAASVDIAPLLRQALSVRKSEIKLRLRFRDVRNNNGQNDNMNNAFGLIRYTFSR